MSPDTVVNNMGKDYRRRGRASVTNSKFVKGMDREIRGGKAIGNYFPQCRADKVVRKGVPMLIVCLLWVDMGTTNNTIQDRSLMVSMAGRPAVDHSAKNHQHTGQREPFSVVMKSFHC